MKYSNIFTAAALSAVLAGSAGTAFAQERIMMSGPASGTSTSPITTVTNITGTIGQLNYDADGAVNGFLIGTNVLLTFSTSVCGGIGTLGAVGNSVTYSGIALTTTAGFESVTVTSFTNNSSKAAYTRATPKVSAYGPTSGALRQLNYDGAGSIDGFLFTPAGSTTPIFVSTGSRASATLKPLLTVGATLSVTGTTSTAMAACSASSELAAVDATGLTVGNQTIVILGGGSIFGIPIKH